jgi:hypothetical protein
MGDIVGEVTGAVGGERGRKGARRGYKRAAQEFDAPNSLKAGGAAYPLFGTSDASVFQNLGKLLAGNSLNELEPALRASSQNTLTQQRSFKNALSRSGLVGSGVDLGNNFAINQAGATRSSDILSQLPQLQRSNLAIALPYFQSFMGDIARRQAGRAGIKAQSAGPNAAGKAESSANMGNAIGSIAAKGVGGGGGKGSSAAMDRTGYGRTWA